MEAMEKLRLAAAESHLQEIREIYYIIVLKKREEDFTRH